MLQFTKIVKMAKTSPIKFLKEVKTELSKVVWPSKKEAVRLTLVVILVSLLVGAFIGGVDFVLTKLMAVIIK